MQDSVRSVMSAMNSLAARADGDPAFSNTQWKAHPLDDSNFCAIEAAAFPKSAFVDGGSATLLDAPNFSLSIARVYANVFDGSRKIYAGKRADFFVLAYSDYENGVKYKAKLFPFGSNDFLPREADLTFDMNDATIADGASSGKVRRMADVARRFAEWRLAEHMAGKLNKGDVVCMDGTLQASYTNERGYAESAFEAAAKRGVAFTALSKTSSLFTTTGNNLLAVLKRRGPEEAWQYYPIADIDDECHRAELLAVKLHRNARHVFRFEIFREQLRDAQRALSALLLNSSDFRLPGYPYGLIDADNMARITEAEKRYYSTLFLAASQNLGDHIAASDAHDILNRIVK